ncbi:MAG: UDP-N-acetylglucosamine 2-epimerase (non-hydrolyzing) [Paludibacter sp.]|nr:UDP-N-acetylglucosamine 2-epimerase (non-hydrolyzing) [Bacteroidales bacterium]MCM1069060.1 UDP-N-acetylglucosamine 2-epimerase (non-hydrolyzing) [Prevotella sp.]MCM1353499.1 UDP-N-acetylglucosamine 2-epimerase (non-hydrolyzing) [Bacteroides sp.]MCM1442660.1 UDP-N-acetylglucosamine 2-epimerase (non-hydrolyzing) [Muribaculum sp.]MCM1481703.1 UDP-N-acetylglucosamine 2-epimerase (non-hydrolyzing) [Paludibacter sp.]
MIRLLTIIGARPQIIKAAAVSRAIQRHFSDVLSETILHTGQHYDDNMSDVFFRELSIPFPDYNLHIGSGTHGIQTARMLEGIESVLMQAMHTDKPFDAVLLYGDTNSTLAGALAAAKLQMPIFHVEAGLRSYNMAMPEEINRIVCDRVASLLFAPTQTAVDNLRTEGLPESLATFANCKKRKVILSGDVMYDNSMYYGSLSAEKTDIIQRLSLSDKQFLLATVHRPANTDSPTKLSSVFSALLHIAEQDNIKIVLPLHPRTRKLMAEKLNDTLFREVHRCTNILLIEPVSFFEIIELEKKALLVLTDSGGVQKEAFFYGTPCVILRPETEWVEIVKAGAGVIADADTERIIEGYRKLKQVKVDFPRLFGDAHAAEKILTEIINYFN